METLTTAVTPSANERVRELLEVEWLVHRMPVPPEAIVSVLTTPDRALIVEGAADPLPAVRAALVALEAAGVAIAVPGGYAPARLPAGLSRRQRTLSLTVRAVLALGRAVRAGDVSAYAREHAPGELEVGGLSPALIARDMSGLTRTGDLVVVAVLRGDHTAGRKLLLPRSYAQDRERWMPRTPLTWLEYVAGHVTHLSQGHAEVNATGDPHRSVLPFTTKQLRARLEADVREGRPVAEIAYGVDLARPMTVTLALQQLAEGPTPMIRSVPKRRALWILEAAEERSRVADDAFATDADRLIEAARQAIARAGTSVVTAAEVRAEIELNPALAPRGRGTVAAMLSDLAKERVDNGGGRRITRRVQRLRRAGTIRGRAFYWVSTGSDDVRTWSNAQEAVALQGLSDEIMCARFEERRDALKHVQSPLVAIGRARQMLAEIRRLSAALDLLPSSTPGIEVHREALGRHHAELDGWLQFRTPREREVPEGVDLEQGGLSAMELRDIFAPLSKTAAAMTEPGQVIRHYSGLIRRVPNPQFINRRSGAVETAAEYLFDPVDALEYGARQWGGPMCRLMSHWAIEEVGELRDPRYLYVALRAARAEQRIRILGGVALMRPRGAEAVLQRHARDDADCGVREGALWSLGMLVGSRADPIAREVSTSDPATSVRRAASRFLELGDQWWWRV
jgi:hypothetical protein